MGWTGPPDPPGPPGIVMGPHDMTRSEGINPLNVQKGEPGTTGPQGNKGEKGEKGSDGNYWWLKCLTLGLFCSRGLFFYRVSHK